MDMPILECRTAGYLFSDMGKKRGGSYLQNDPLDSVNARSRTAGSSVDRGGSRGKYGRCVYVLGHLVRGGYLLLSVLSSATQTSGREGILKQWQERYQHAVAEGFVGNWDNYLEHIDFRYMSSGETVVHGALPNNFNDLSHHQRSFMYGSTQLGKSYRDPCPFSGDLGRA